MQHVIHATGPSVVLREMTATDVDAFCDWRLPHQEWHTWDGPYFAKASVEEIEALRVRMHEEFASAGPTPADPAGQPNRLLIATRDEPDAFVGAVSWHWESKETNWRRMGLTVYDPATRGRGIGAEALALWTTYLFEHTDVTRLDFSTWSGNAAMLGVGRKLGFVEEARFRRARLVRGEYFDSVVMGVLREEWAARRAIAPQAATGPRNRGIATS